MCVFFQLSEMSSLGPTQNGLGPSAKYRALLGFGYPPPESVRPTINSPEQITDRAPSESEPRPGLWDLHFERKTSEAPREDILSASREGLTTWISNQLREKWKVSHAPCYLFGLVCQERLKDEKPVRLNHLNNGKWSTGESTELSIFSSESEEEKICWKRIISWVGSWFLSSTSLAARKFYKVCAQDKAKCVFEVGKLVAFDSYYIPLWIGGVITKKHLSSRVSKHISTRLCAETEQRPVLLFTLLNEQKHFSLSRKYPLLP